MRCDPRSVESFPEIRVIYPVHMNPNVVGTVEARLGNRDRVHLIPPVDYFQFLSLLRRCYLVLTDSGGVQEEAPIFHKPVLVLRKVTERPGSFADGHGEGGRNLARSNRAGGIATPE